MLRRGLLRPVPPQYVVAMIHSRHNRQDATSSVRKVPLFRKIWLKIPLTRHGSLSMSREKPQKYSGSAAVFAAAPASAGPGSSHPFSSGNVKVNDSSEAV